MTITCLGLVAGAITSVAGIPQVMRVYRTRQVRDLSVWQPVLLSIGITLWLIYGIIINDMPLIVADLVSLVCCLLLLGMIFRYRQGDNGPAGHYISYESVNKEET